MKNKKFPSDLDKPVTTRGRPPRISREEILAAAVTLLNHDDTLPSIKGVARAMGVAPMTLYTYFANKDDFLQAVSERLISELEFDIPAGAAPLDKIVRWARAMREYFLAHPKLIDMLEWSSGNVSLAWVRRALMLTEFVDALGFPEEDAIYAQHWITHVVMSAISLELRHRSGVNASVIKGIETLEQQLRERVAAIQRVREKADFDAVFFEYQLERLSTALMAMAGKHKKANVRAIKT